VIWNTILLLEQTRTLNMTFNGDDIVNKFNEQYAKLDTATQVTLDHFLAGIDEVGQHIVGETIFRGSAELLNRYMPCIQAISSSVRISETGLDGDSNLHELKWEPNDFVIPSDVLVRAYARIENPGADSDDGCGSEEEHPLVRQMSSQSRHCENDDCPSSR